MLEILNQKDVITVEAYNKESNRFNKTDYIVISRDEYNRVTKQCLACRIVYTDESKPFLVPIEVSGLRRNGKTNTLNIHMMKQYNPDATHSVVDKISDKEFMKIAQGVTLNFNFPL